MSFELSQGLADMMSGQIVGYGLAAQPDDKPDAVRPGDIGLSGTRSQGVVSLAIKLGSVLRHEPNAGALARGMFLGGPPLAAFICGVLLGGGWLGALFGSLIALVLAVALIVLVAALYGFRSKNRDWFSHSFIVHHVDPDGTVWITESVGTGSRTVRMHYQPGDYVWLCTSVWLTGDDEQEMRALLDSVTAARWKYDYGTFAGLAIYAITGAMLAPAGVGTAICSGLTSEALTRGRAIWPLPAYRMMPQDQYEHALRTGIEIVHTG